MVVQFGKIVRVEQDAGLKFKVPFVENVVRYSKKVQSWDGDAQRLPTSENQFIWVDTTARWRISDPKKFYESVGSMKQAHGTARRRDRLRGAQDHRAAPAARGGARLQRDQRDQAGQRARGLRRSAPKRPQGLSNITTLVEITYERIEKGRSALSDRDARGRGADHAPVRHGAHRRDHPADQVLRRPHPERLRPDDQGAQPDRPGLPVRRRGREGEVARPDGARAEADPATRSAGPRRSRRRRTPRRSPSATRPTRATPSSPTTGWPSRRTRPCCRSSTRP